MSQYSLVGEEHLQKEYTISMEKYIDFFTRRNGLIGIPLADEMFKTWFINLKNIS
jgi:hypothetical protein